MSGFFARMSARLRGGGADAAMPAPTADAAYGAALAAYRGGRIDEARAALHSALAADPAHFDALQLTGAVMHQAGDSAGAIDYLARAAAIRPDDATASSNLGLVQLALGRSGEAEASLRRATAANPGWDRAWNNLGVVLQAQGRLHEADECFAQALARNASCVDALVNRANLAKDANRSAEAEAGYRQALAVDDRRSEAWLALGHVLQARGRTDDAASCFEKVLALQPGSAQAQNGMGLVHRARGEAIEAQACFRRALAIDPAQADVLCNLGSLLQAHGRWAEAERCGRDALALRPDFLNAHLVTAAAQKASGRLDDAEALLRAALARDPQSAAVQYNLATLALLRGDYPEGFTLFERRFEAFAGTPWAASAQAGLLSDSRRWLGGDLAGGHILVWSEQGFGDTLMMLRFLPLLKARGAGQVLFACEPPLARLAARVAGVDAVVSFDALPAAESFDCHCAAMSLPLRFGATAAVVPGDIPCVVVPNDLVMLMRERIRGDGRMRVGLAWAGSATLQDDARRSIPLDSFAPLLSLPHVQWFSLQKGPAGATAAQWPGVRTEPIDACTDFLDTAALMRNLDLVISVDTAAVHLAGTLGVPVWLLNRTENEWRWGVDGEGSAWYPSLRIFRQRAGEDWAPALDRVASALATRRSESASPAKEP